MVDDQVDLFANIPEPYACRIRSGDDGDEIRLPAWAARFGGGCAEWFSVTLEPETEVLGAAHRDGLIALLAGEAAILDGMLKAVDAALPVLGERYDVDMEALFGAGLAVAITPRAVVLHDPGAGPAVTGVEFDCGWDPERGLGLLLRAGRVLGIGPGDTAFATWKARRAAQGENDFFFWKPADRMPA